MKLPRLRFGLRTLAIFTLFSGSAMLIWHDWQPWGVTLFRDGYAGFSPNSQFLLTTGKNCLQVWNTRAQACEHVLNEDECIRNPVWFPDSSAVAVVCGERVVIWDANSGKTRRALEVGQISRNAVLTISPDCDRLLIHGAERQSENDPPQPMELWDIASGKKLATFGLRYRFQAFFPDGRLLLLNVESEAKEPLAPITFDQFKSARIELWDAVSGKLRFRFTEPPTCVRHEVTLLGSIGVCDVAIEETSGFQGNHVSEVTREWDCQGKLMTEHRKPLNAIPTQSKASFRPYTLGKYCARAPNCIRTLEIQTRGLRIFDANTSRVLWTFPNPKGAEMIDAAFSPDGKFIFVEGFSDSGPVNWLLNFQYSERWWGALRMWEFWLAAVLGIAMVWSVFCDRRELRAQE